MKFAATLLLLATTHPIHAATLPDISTLIETAYPTWCINENEQRLTAPTTCADGTPNGRFSPIYLTKQFSGADPALRGYPTPLDIQYVFEYASPYLGQPCAGSPHHCPEDFDGSNEMCKSCPTMVTENDHGPNGPGHVPPHISLAAVTKAYNEGLESAGEFSTWFDYDQNACRILPTKLLHIVRAYYPRDPTNGNKPYYPPPYSVEGGSYPLEFANLDGASCDAKKTSNPTAGALDCLDVHSPSVEVPDTLQVGYGSPHYCSKASAAVGVASDYCPYITFGPNRGKYRHPHLGYSAVEVYLANMIMPDKCGDTWDDSNYPPNAVNDNTQAFPQMNLVTTTNRMKDHDQPTIYNNLWVWPAEEGRKKKTTMGQFSNHLVVIPGNTASNTGVVSDTANGGDGAGKDGLVDGSDLGPISESGGAGLRTMLLQSVIFSVSVVVLLMI